MTKSGLISALQGLLESGDFSDFTITCAGEEFKVHKAIVCSQSPVFTAAFRGPLKEARTNIIEVQFDPVIVKLMLDFLYTGTYDASHYALDSRNAKSLVAAETPEGSTTASSSDDQQEALLAQMSASLRYHVRMNEIAGYYMIPELAKTANANLRSCFTTAWSSDWFCLVARYLSTYSCDEEWHRTLGELAVQHGRCLVGHDSLKQLDCFPGFALECFKACISEIQSLRAALESKKDVPRRKII